MARRKELPGCAAARAGPFLGAPTVLDGKNFQLALRNDKYENGSLLAAAQYYNIIAT